MRAHLSRPVAVALVALVASACGGPPRSARVAVFVATEALVVADRVAADAHASAADRALTASVDHAAYLSAMAPYERLESSLRIAHATVRALHAAMDAWDDGGAERWVALAGCVSASLAELAGAFEALGADVPSELRHALDFAATLGEPVCSGSGTVTVSASVSG